MGYPCSEEILPDSIMPLDKIYNGGSSNTKKILDVNWFLLTLMISLMGMLVVWSSTAEMNTKMKYIKQD